MHLVNWLNAQGITPDLVLIALATMLVMQAGGVGRQMRRGWRLALRTSPAWIALAVELLKGQ